MEIFLSQLPRIKSPQMPSEQVRSSINQSVCRLGLRSRGQHSWALIPSSEDYTSPNQQPVLPTSPGFLPFGFWQHTGCAKAHIKPAHQNLGALSGLCCQSGKRGTTLRTWWERSRSLDWTGGKLESTSCSVCIGASPLASLGLNFPLCKIKGGLTNPYSSNPDWWKRENTCT